MTGMKVEVHIYGRDYHIKLTIYTCSHIERQLERQGSASLWP